MALINCPECGREISDQVKACPHCGYPFEKNGDEEVNTNYENLIPTSKAQVNKKMTKYTKIIIGLIVVAILSIGTIIVVQSVNPVGKFVSLVKNEKRDDAIALYDKKIKNDDDKLNQAKEIIKQDIDDVYSQYYDEKLSYDDATAKLDVYDGYDISKLYVSSNQEKLDALKSSRKAYSDAQEAGDSGDIETAIKKYSAVIEEDPKYADAKAKVKELRENYKQKLEDEAANYAENKQYTEAISDIDQLITVLGSDDEFTELKEKYSKMKAEQYVKIKVTDKGTVAQNTSKWIFNNYVTLVFEIKNNSDKAITGIEGVLTANDLFGKEIVSINCDFTGMTIKPNKKYIEDDLSYECNEFIDSDMKFYNTAFKDLQFQYDITSIVYSDGTTVKPK